MSRNPADLPAYSGPDAACPECGCKTVDSILMRSLSDAEARFGKFGSVAYFLVASYRLPLMGRRCRTCGNVWLEAPLSAKPAVVGETSKKATT
jgi:hypothetical protein